MVYFVFSNNISSDDRNRNIKIMVNKIKSLLVKFSLFMVFVALLFLYFLLDFPLLCLDFIGNLIDSDYLTAIEVEYLERVFTHVYLFNNVTFFHFITIFIVTFGLTSMDLFTYKALVVLVLKVLWLILFIYILRKIINIDTEKDKK